MSRYGLQIRWLIQRNLAFVQLKIKLPSKYGYKEISAQSPLFLQWTFIYCSIWRSISLLDVYMIE